MKLILYFSILVACMGSSLALKHADCGLPHAKDGFDDGIVCLARGNRWSYDAVSNKCTVFVYGSCGGNANNFFTQQDCENKCLE
ncbi:uncharacterized protein Dvir_GJ25823 [Drosophila virilis]|uniref:BPTI/Kunitz inhibitor domain-containing protein n=1 Tax=Drosophila virilis TaxID=7244 RepID=A0A0Q9WJH6_DROVI|nr:uncharacterized protein Dvir_GJ25823 [Drosophila virilis]